MSSPIAFYWNKNTDYRSYLYFSYLLHLKYGDTGRDELHSFEDELRKYTTIQSNFDQIVNDLISAGIVIDSVKYHLSPKATQHLEPEFIESFGTSSIKDLVFNAMTIFEADVDQRYKDWLVAGLDALETLFRDIEISVKFIETRNKLFRLALIQTSPSEPFTCWGFFNIPRMEDEAVLQELILLQSNEMIRRSNGIKAGIEGYHSDGLLSRVFVAGITFSSEATEYLLRNSIRSLGPINYEALIHYFTCHVVYDDGSSNAKAANVVIRSVQYKAFIDAMCRLAPAGVIFSNDIISFMNNDTSLQTAYETHKVVGCKP